MPTETTPHIILTTYGTDGAAAAAMVLLQHPHAEILRTSSTRVGATLLEVARRPPAHVHVCGVGPNDTSEHILEGLDALKSKGFSTTWYCGRGYMDSWREPMAPFCETAFLDCGSNAGAVRAHLAIRKSKRVELLLALGEEYADSTRTRAAEHLFWHDLVHHSAAQYFKYEDDQAFVDVIRKLAGQEDVTGRDERQVEAFRSSSGRAVPLGASKAMRSLRRTVARLAPLDEPVLILGPSGVGKELVAGLLHEASLRSGAPFVPVNCAILATSSDLAHDRLFGHVEGAYTGARASQAGAFEAADGGTLFLDEVAELPVAIQTQLLRVLEEGTITPLGTVATRPVNVRIVAATNQSLPSRVREGRFRLDLYHRLNVLRIRVPALKDRKPDMKSIAQSVAHDFAARGHALTLTRADWQAVHEYDWPGNVRQFINVLKRAAYMGNQVRDVLAEEAAEERALEASSRTEMSEALCLFLPGRPEDVTPEDEVRRAYMRHVFEVCDRNWSRTAKALGVAVNTLRKWMDA